MAFDAASGKRLWETPHGRRFSNDRGDGPRATPDGRRRSASTRSARAAISACWTPRAARSVWTVNVLEQVRRLEHQLGPERVAAGAERPDPAQRRRHDRRAEEDRRLADLDRARATSAGYSSAVAQKSAASTQAIFFTSRAVRSASTSTRPAAVELRPGREQRRQHRDADRAGQPRLRLVRLRHGVGAAGADAVRQQRHRARGVLHPSDAEPSRHVGARGRASLWLRQRDPHRDEVRHRRGRLAGPQRRQGLARSSPTTGCTSSARGVWSGWPKRRPPAIASTAASRSRPAACRPGAIRSSPGGKLFLRDQDTIYAYDVRAEIGIRSFRP